MAVLFAPGNGGNRQGRAMFAQALSERGFAVLLMDYRGYGGNPGSPSEEGLAADANAAAEALEELGYPADRTIYFGESLGTGVVSALQARRPPAGVVLRSPFTSLADVGAHHYPWLPVRALIRDRFPVPEHFTSEQRAGHGDLRRPRLGRSLGAERPRGRRTAQPGRAPRAPGRRPQRPGHVRIARGRRSRAVGRANLAETRDLASGRASPAGWRRPRRLRRPRRRRTARRSCRCPSPGWRARSPGRWQRAAPRRC